jgi:hypothetical protein
LLRQLVAVEGAGVEVPALMEQGLADEMVVAEEQPSRVWLPVVVA